MAASTEDIMGYAVDKRGIGECVDEMVEWITKGDHCRWLACINPHSYVVACKDKTFEKALREADWLIRDGIGIVIASRLLKGEIHKRITGPDIFGLLQVELNRKGGFNVFF